MENNNTHNLMKLFRYLREFLSGLHQRVNNELTWQMVDVVVDIQSSERFQLWAQYFQPFSTSSRETMNP